MADSNSGLASSQVESAVPLPLAAALLPVMTLVTLLIINVFIFTEDASYGPNQLALVVAAVVAGVIGWILKVPFERMLTGVKNSIGSALNAILILLMIGALAGTWLISGVVPAMVCYGLQILNAEYFLVASVVICAIVSMITGSSWSTIATVGVALLGIGDALGLSGGMVAGAVISGAYFGDKMSPLSDTTNLASAMAGSELFSHIRYMLWTTVPSIVITLIAFLVIGLMRETTGSTEQANELAVAISEKFYITPWLMLVPLGTLVLVACKVDAVVALFFGSVLGAIFALIFQSGISVEHDIINEVGAGGSSTLRTSVQQIAAGVFGEGSMSESIGSSAGQFQECYIAVVQAFTSKVEIASGNEDAAKLMSTKGMAGMLNTVWLIICAMCFGGVMEATGLLHRITQPLVDMAQSTWALIATTCGSCLFLNVTASDQYLAIVVPGRMFRESYENRGLAPENLSRTLEDSGTVTSVLVPWNTCGAAQATVLGITTLTYLPWCFFNLLSPLMSIFVAMIGFRILKLKKA